MSALLEKIRSEWFSNVRGDLLAGTVVALALIPEAIAFSIIAGVDPKVGLYASFCIAVVTAFLGGRPGMISAATGAMALVMVDLVKSHGLEYLLAATILTGFLQVLAGFFRLGALIRFVSRSVITGFVNALAILIFMAQVPELVGGTWHVYPMVAAGLAIIYLLPRLTTAVPSALVCIVVLTLVALVSGLPLRTVGDMGQLPTEFPAFLLPKIPLTFETLRLILPYSCTLAVVGLLESMMTATIVDDMTDTYSDKNRECAGQGAGNIVAGLFGGMAGCAMIGQSVINVKSGGRKRLSTLFAGLFLLFLILVLSDVVRRIPMAALVAVMTMVSIGTFNWGSLKSLVVHPKSSSVVMLSTVVVTVATRDLAKGVLVGVLLSTLFFAMKVERIVHVRPESLDGGLKRIYHVSGQLFFVSSHAFIRGFDFNDPAERVEIEFTHAHFWDISAIAALDKVVMKFRKKGVEVELIGLNEASSTMIDRLGTHDKPAALDLPVGH
ncbi:SulP family inorganic anion transporter [Isosphaeraceae bacterium EP7]